jgi:hypothetical protein
MNALMRKLIPGWDYLAWFDVKRARDWQLVVWTGLVVVLLLAALGIANLL